MPDTCPYCLLDTAGQHTIECPLHPNNYVETRTDSVTSEEMQHAIRIDPDEIRWVIEARLNNAFVIDGKRPALRDMTIELSWGWTPFDETPDNWAEDAPMGCGRVTTTVEMARDLRDRLDTLIQTAEANASEAGAT